MSIPERPNSGRVSETSSERANFLPGTRLHRDQIEIAQGYEHLFKEGDAAQVGTVREDGGIDFPDNSDEFDTEAGIYIPKDGWQLKK